MEENPQPTKSSPDVKFEIGHVLFIDIVGYSKSLIDEQKKRLRQLTGIVLATTQVAKSTNEQLAQRVMDCGDAGHIFVSQRAAEDLSA